MSSTSHSTARQPWCQTTVPSLELTTRAPNRRSASSSGSCVLAYDGSRMKEVSAAETLNIAMAGTSATLLARRWESALLVNVDNETLRRLLASEEAINALMNIEGFRSLNSDIEAIINKSEAVKKATNLRRRRRGSSLQKGRSSSPSARKSKRSLSSSQRASPCSCILPIIARRRCSMSLRNWNRACSRK